VAGCRCGTVRCDEDEVCKRWADESRGADAGDETVEMQRAEMEGEARRDETRRDETGAAGGRAGGRAGTAGE